MAYKFSIRSDSLGEVETRTGVALVDDDGVILSVDECLGDMAALAPQDIVGRPLGALLQGFDLAAPGHGRLGDLECNYACLQLPNGTTAVSIATNSSAVQRTKEALRAFEELVEASAAGIVVLDGDKKVRLWNKAAEEIFGWTKGEIIGERYPLVPQSEWGNFCILFDRVMQGDGYRNIESTRLRKDGSSVALNMSTTPLRNADGEVVAALALLNDISQQKQLEEKLSERARLEAIGQLASGVAHDFNNMLTVISAHSSFLRRSPRLALSDLASLDLIERCVEQASELTSKLLTFGRKQIVHPTEVDVRSSIEESMQMLRKVYPRNIEIEFDDDGGPAWVFIDRTQLSQALVNLMGNARDSMPDGGCIRLALRHEEDDGVEFVVVDVSDSGCGIAEEDLGKIFEPFFTTKGPGEGTGLGLATTYGIMQQSMGRIDVASKVGQGTTMTLSLPQHDAPVGLVGAQIPTAPSTTSLSVELVDDEPLVLQSVAGIIEHFGYDIHCFGSGAACLEALESYRPDVLLTDVYMPEMDGSTLADRARQLYPDLPVVFMSGDLTDPSLRDKIQQTSYTFISKPLEFDKLEETLATVLAHDD